MTGWCAPQEDSEDEEDEGYESDGGTVYDKYGGYTNAEGEYVEGPGYMSEGGTEYDAYGGHYDADGDYIPGADTDDEEASEVRYGPSTSHELLAGSLLM